MATSSNIPLRPPPKEPPKVAPKVSPLLSMLSVKYSPLMDEKSYESAKAKRNKYLLNKYINNEEIKHKLYKNRPNVSTNGTTNDSTNGTANGSTNGTANGSKNLLQNGRMIPERSLGDDWKPEPTSPFVDFIIQNSIDQVIEMIESGHSMETEDRHGFKPLHYACRMGHAELVKALIDKGNFVKGLILLFL